MELNFYKRTLTIQNCQNFNSLFMKVPLTNLQSLTKNPADSFKISIYFNFKTLILYPAEKKTFFLKFFN